jgi:hypothetical protein
MREGSTMSALVATGAVAHSLACSRGVMLEFNFEGGI